MAATKPVHITVRVEDKETVNRDLDFNQRSRVTVAEGRVCTVDADCGKTHQRFTFQGGQKGEVNFHMGCGQHLSLVLNGESLTITHGNPPEEAPEEVETEEQET